MRRYDSAPIGNIRKTGAGGLRVDANLTRTGIFTYQTPNGPRREYRPNDEVFKADALDGFRGAPVTVGHPGLVTPANWRTLSVGHVGDDVRADGSFVAASVIIQDADTIAKVERGELRELSCGYDVDLDETPGTTPEGERYDAIQRNIRGNHVALGPEGWGRAGRDVRLRLDGNEDAPDATLNLPGMDKTEVQAKDVVIKVDGGAEIEKLKARCDFLEAQNKDLQAKLDAAPAEAEKRIAARVALVTAANKVAPEVKADGKTDREIMVEVLSKKAPTMRFDGRGDEYVRAAFDMVIDAAEKAPTQALGALRADAHNAQIAEDPIEAARKKNEQRGLNAWKTK